MTARTWLQAQTGVRWGKIRPQGVPGTLSSNLSYGAEDGIQTHDPLLGKWMPPHIRVSLRICRHPESTESPYLAVLRCLPLLVQKLVQ